MSSYSVTIADSSELIRLGLRAALANHSNIEIASEAKNKEELFEQIEAFHPDVVLIDYAAEDFDLATIPEALLKDKNLKFIAITKEQAAQTIVDALRIGVMSHIKKNCSIQEIQDAVLETARGNKFFCGKILERIREEKINVDDIEFEQLSCEPISLSERELEIITLIAEGNTNGQIAEQLFLSAHTVNTHRKNVMKKLGVNNTAGMVMYAVKTQLVSPNKFLFAANS